MAALNHVHQYIRAIGRLTKANQDSKLINFYKCDHPQCTHLQKAELVLGKQSICNGCGKEFTLARTMRALLNRPICKSCKKKKLIQKQTTDELLDEIMS